MDDSLPNCSVRCQRLLDALQGVINGNTPVIVSIDRASDIEVLIEFVNEYSINAVINGGSEAWMLADELAAASIPVIVGPTANLPGNFERYTPPEA